jgi:hypothetical protein
MAGPGPQFHQLGYLFHERRIINMSDPEPPQKPRGCFFYGCVTCLALFLLAGVILLLGGWYMIRWTNAMLAEYTDTVPMALPKVDMPPEELATLKARVADFKHALDAHAKTSPLVLTAREINALMEDSPQVKQMNLNDKFYVYLEGDHIKGQISLPLDQLPKIPFVHTAGRYLNGTGEMTAEVTNAELSVTIISLEARGKPLPAKFMGPLQQQNLADQVNQNPTNVTLMSRLESVEIKDSTVIIKAKPN